MSFAVRLRKATERSAFATELVHIGGADVGLGTASLALGGLAAFRVLAALLLWPRNDPEAIAHSHDDLPPDHPHLRGDGRAHSHPFVIDDYHIPAG